MSAADPDRLSEGDGDTAALLSAYAARSRAAGSDEGAAWQRLQPVLDARLPRRRRWLQPPVLAGAFTVALGLFVLARSAPSWVHTEAAARRHPKGNEGAGGGGAFGSLVGDSRGAGGMEGTSGRARRTDGV